jgi:hypothetical protein
MKTTTTNRIKDVLTQSALIAVTTTSRPEQTPATAEREQLQNVPTLAEYLYNTANNAVNSVLQNRFNQTGVDFYRELNAPYNKAIDRILYNYNNKGITTADIKAEQTEIKKQIDSISKDIKKLSKFASDITTTPNERKAIAKALFEHTSELSRLKAINHSLTTDRQLLHSATIDSYSDRYSLIQSALSGYFGYNRADFTAKEIETAREKALNQIEEIGGDIATVDFLIDKSLQFKAMCRAISANMGELCNPQVENTYRNKRVRVATADEITAFIKAVGGVGRDWKYYTTSYGAYRTFYTIEDKSGEYYIIKHYATTNTYQYINAMGINSEGEEIELDTILTKACKHYTRFDSYFTYNQSDIEQLLELMQTAQFTEREQLFIKKLSAVAKLYDDSKDALKVAMCRCGIMTDTAQRKFLSRLRAKLTAQGYTYRQHKPQNRQYTPKLTECKRVDLLKWCEVQPMQADFAECVDVWSYTKAINENEPIKSFRERIENGKTYNIIIDEINGNERRTTTKAVKGATVKRYIAEFSETSTINSFVKYDYKKIYKRVKIGTDSNYKSIFENVLDRIDGVAKTTIITIIE